MPNGERRKEKWFDRHKGSLMTLLWLFQVIYVGFFTEDLILLLLTIAWVFFVASETSEWRPEEAKEAILEELAKGPKRADKLAEELGLSRSWTYDLLRELINEGKVTRVKRGVFAITEEGRKSLPVPWARRFWLGVQNLKSRIVSKLAEQ